MHDTHGESACYHAGYPLYLTIEARRIVVIGGGAVAERKVETLLEYGADVVVVSPEITPALTALVQAGRIVWIERPYAAGDLSGCSIAFCACGDPMAEEAICAEAAQVGCLINVVDVPERCDFIVPSIVARGPLRIAVSTSGTAPTEAKSIRRQLEREFDESWSDYLTLMGQVRALVKQRVEGSDAQRYPIYEAASAAGWRQRLAAGERIEVEDAYREAVEAAAKEAR
jgi:precorrin-2 dehydrogenase/sirohydrochlorin ferrochelatase